MKPAGKQGPLKHAGKQSFGACWKAKHLTSAPEATEVGEGLWKQPDEAGELESPAGKDTREGGQKQQATKGPREGRQASADVASGEGEHEESECGG